MDEKYIGRWIDDTVDIGKKLHKCVSKRRVTSEYVSEFLGLNVARERLKDLCNKKNKLLSNEIDEGFMMDLPTDDYEDLDGEIKYMTSFVKFVENSMAPFCIK